MMIEILHSLNKDIFRRADWLVKPLVESPTRLPDVTSPVVRCRAGEAEFVGIRGLLGAMRLYAHLNPSIRLPRSPAKAWSSLTGRSLLLSRCPTPRTYSQSANGWRDLACSMRSIGKNRLCVGPIHPPNLIGGNHIPALVRKGPEMKKGAPISLWNQRKSDYCNIHSAKRISPCARIPARLSRTHGSIHTLVPAFLS